MYNEIERKLKSVKRNIAIIKIEVIILLLVIAFLAGVLVGRAAS